MNDSTRFPEGQPDSHARPAIGLALAVLAEAFPLVVALLGAGMWVADVRLTFYSITLDRNSDQIIVGALLAPTYFIAGMGWFLIGRRSVGCTVLLLHDLAALVAVFFGVVLVNGAGELAGPGPDPPTREFYVSLSISLLVSALSVVWLAAAALRRDRARSNPHPAEPERMAR